MFNRCCTTRMVFIWTLVVALLLGGSLLLAFWGIPKIIKEKIHEQTRLEKGTDQWDRFEELPFPIDFTVRFFNVTNHLDVLNKNAKPNLTETEPYNYKLSLKKKNIRFDDDDEDSVTYNRQMTFEFDESGTTKETDVVTIVNSVLLASLQLTSTVERLALAGCIDKLLTPFGMGEMFITAPVHKILFDGIFFSYANNSIGYACKLIRTKMLKIIGGIRVIEHIEGNGDDYLKFSVFNYKTDSYVKPIKPDGIYTVNRGIDDMSQLGNIMRWNGDTYTTTWGNSRTTNNDTCNKVGGTDSTIYKPQLDKDEQLEIFNTDICRPVKLIYKNSDESYEGVKTYRYETSPTTFRPSTSNVENDCFCAKATKDVNGSDNCFLDGVFDFKPCLDFRTPLFVVNHNISINPYLIGYILFDRAFGNVEPIGHCAPVLVSLPHFLHADDHYVNALNGLSPDESKHNIYLLIEPNTGTPMVGMKRIQLNSVMRREKFISMITPDTMYEAVMPILWLEEGVHLPQKYVDLVNNQYFKAVKITDGIKYALIALFSALFVVCLFFMWRKEFFKRNTTS